MDRMPSDGAKAKPEGVSEINGHNAFRIILPVSVTRSLMVTSFSSYGLLLYELSGVLD